MARTDVDIMNEINERITELENRGTIIKDKDFPEDNYLKGLLYDKEQDEIFCSIQGL